MPPKIFFNDYDFFSLKTIINFLSHSAKPQGPRSVQEAIKEVLTVLFCTEFNLFNAAQTATCIFKCLKIC